MPNISVVVCTYNRAPLLRRAVSSLLALEHEEAFTYEVVVVDDGSTDDTPVVLEELALQRVNTVRRVCGEGRGVAAARNTGVAAAVGEFVAFFDDDQIAEKNWLLELWRLQVASGAACVGGPRALLFEQTPTQTLPETTRLILGEISATGNVRRYERDDLLCTGNLMLRRSVFDDIGGFNDALLQGGEDTDLFRRMREAQLECWYTPTALVHHIIPAYRLELKYIRWTAVRGGHCYARRDIDEWGVVRTIGIATLRLGHGVVVHGGRWLLGVATRNTAEAVAGQCHLARSFAYAREAVSALGRRQVPAPVETEFRSERVLFAESKHLDG